MGLQWYSSGETEAPQSHVVGSLTARPGHSRDTPVTETTWTYCRHFVQVAGMPRNRSSTGWRYPSGDMTRTFTRGISLNAVWGPQEEVF